jgi:ABC-2 type transport system permease protein
LLVLFCWLFVWLMSFFDVGKWQNLLSLLPNFVQPMLGVPLNKLASPAGQLSILYTHVVTLLVCVGWAVGRGSDSISGEIGRGTMDLLLSLPVWQITVMIVPAVVAALGTAVLAASVWVGTALGLSSVRFADPPPLGQFLPGAANLFAMTFCFTGITTLVSSGNRDRWRTISLSGRVLHTVADFGIRRAGLGRRPVAPLPDVSQPVRAAGVDPRSFARRLDRAALRRYPNFAGAVELRGGGGGLLVARHPGSAVVLVPSPPGRGLG